MLMTSLARDASALGSIEVEVEVEDAAQIWGPFIVKLRFNRWRRYRGRQPAGPAGCGTALVVL